ncbi:MAG: hypothetical protein SGILL_000792, partial [Bacillariaceae sp.]
EEAVPQALSHRPNLVTKTALVEQAHALSKYEVDTLEKYDQLFGSSVNAKGGNLFGNRQYSKRLPRAVADTRKTRILRHHAKMLAAKRGNLRQSSSSSPTPLPQLVAGLRSVYESTEAGSSTSSHDDSSTLRSLLKSVMEHPAFRDDEKRGAKSPHNVTTSIEGPANEDSFGGNADNIENHAYSLESLIGFLCAQAIGDGSASQSSGLPSSSPPETLEHGLMIAVLSVLMGYQAREEGKEDEQKDDAAEDRRTPKTHDTDNDPVAVPPLQVGSILSLLKLEAEISVENSWALDDELVSYFGEAASVYEERIEIQKARLLRRLEAEKKKEDLLSPQLASAEELVGDLSSRAAALPAEVTEQASSSPVTPTPTIASPQPGDTPATPGTPDAVATEVRQEDIEASAAALSAAVFEQIVSSASGEELSAGSAEPLGVDPTGNEAEASQNNNDLEEFVVENDSDQGDDDDDGDGDDSSSSSSSSSDSEAGPGENDDDDFDEDEDEDDEEAEEDDDMALRQALALSLVEQVESAPTDSSVPGEETDMGPISEGSTSEPVTPGNQTPLSAEESEMKEQIEDSPLPPMPPTPKNNPYSEKLFRDVNDESDDEGKILRRSLDPSALNLFGSIPASQILVRLLCFLGQVMDRRQYDEVAGDSATMGKTSSAARAIPGGIGASLFSSLHPFSTVNQKVDSGSDISVSLQLLVALFLLSMERRHDAIQGLDKAIAQESKVSQEGDAKTDSSARRGQEGDDPAIAMALTYFDEDASESKESLEAKGMTRKAAAAAHDAAVLLKERAHGKKK